MTNTDPTRGVHDAASLAAHYTERVNAAVAVERLDLIADLADEYLVELAALTAA